MTPLIDSATQIKLLALSFVCLGTWILTFKAQKGTWRFELFAIDFSLGAFLASLGAAFLLGTFGTELPFDERLLVSSRTAQATMIFGGLLFGVGNTLLLGAVSLMGIAGSYGVAGSVALAVGLAAFYRPSFPPGLGLEAPLLFVVASVLSALACRSLEQKIDPRAKGAPLGPIRLRRSTKGILVASLGGIAISLSCPVALRGAFDEFGLAPYAGLFLFCTGILIVNLVFSLYFFNIALEGRALPLRSYLKGWPRMHWLGILGGAIWAAGALAWLLTRSTVHTETSTSSASYLPLASVVLTMLLGIVLWREFAKASKAASVLISLALLSLAAGLAVLVAS